MRLRIELAGFEYDIEDRVDLRRVDGMLTVQGVSMWLSMRHGLTRRPPSPHLIVDQRFERTCKNANAVRVQPDSRRPPARPSRYSTPNARGHRPRFPLVGAGIVLMGGPHE